MDKIRNLKYKTSQSSENGLFNKITKRYSNVSSKLIRRKSSGRKSTSPHKTASGSYDMTGNGLDEYKMEIGAPILISSTTIDTDRFDINGKPLKLSSTDITNISSESENEIYADALNSFTRYQEENNYKQSISAIKKDENKLNEIDPTSVIYDVPRRKKSISMQKNRSKSAQNLHKSELRVYLQKAPSLELDLKLTTADLDNCYDLPRKTEKKTHVTSPIISPPPPPPPTPPPPPPLPASTPPPLSTLSSPSESQSNAFFTPPKIIMSKSEPNTPQCLDKPDIPISHCKSAESLQEANGDIQQNLAFSSDISLNSGSQNSVFNSSLEDFNLKSASCHSLNAENLFLSINELNDITQQINESEEFNKEIDFEYCEHRDNLKPSERRITLLKNKNTRLINLYHNKQKLNNAWCGIKNWIGEERGRIKKVVQKHASMQKIGVDESNYVPETNNRLRSKIYFNQTPSQLTKNYTDIYDSLNYDNQTNSSRDIYSNLSTLKSSTNRTVVGDNTNLDESNFMSESNNRLKSQICFDRPPSQLITTDTEINPNLNCRDQMNSPRDVCSNLSTSLQSSSEHTIVGDNTNLDDSDSFRKTYRELSPFSKTKKLKEDWKGQNGFEELRRYIKQGGDFGKDLMGILQERVDSEQLYAKSLSKMASKLNKACREIPGTIADAWRGVASEMESRSEVHRQFASSLVEEIVKPLKIILDTEHKTRKTIENSVDKSSRTLAEWRISEAKAKKVSHSAARENEKLQDAMLDARIQKSPSIALLHQSGLQTNGVNKTMAEKEYKNAEKDCAKLDNKRRKAEEAVKRADVEYYTLCLRAERARVDWEVSVLRGSTILQNLENMRLINMKNYLSSYLRLISDMNPVLERIFEQLSPHINACNVQKDINVVKNIRKASEGPSEQLLPDFYCEHTTLAMNRERRKHSLIKLLQLVKADIERERRSRNGLKSFSQKLNSIDSQSLADKLYHIRSMLMYLEGARFKLHSALLELDHKPRNSHLLAPHIQVTRDRTGLQQSILKVPSWLKNNDKMNGDCQDNDYDLESQTENSCIDIKNEILIQNFDKNFNRSKSSSDIIRFNGQQQQQIVQQKLQQNQQQNHQQKIVCDNPKAQTLPIKDIDSPGFDRGIADGGSNQPDSDFDEFSSQDDDDDDDDDNDNSEENDNCNKNDEKNHHNNSTTIIDQTDNNSTTTTTNDNNDENFSTLTNCLTNNKKPIVISRCKALYSYTPKLYDELELNPGDIIEVHAKQEDGWWLGALKNQIGIFPATYVEEFI